MRLAPIFAVPALLAAAAFGQAPALPAVPDSTFGLVRADLDQLDAPAMFKAMTTQVDASATVPAAEKAKVLKTLGEAEADVSRWAADFRKAGGKAAFVVFDATAVSGQSPAILVPVDAGADERALTNLLTTGHADQAPRAGSETTALRVNDLLIAGPTTSIGRYKTLAPKPRPELTAALDGAGATPARFAFVPTAQLKMFAEAGLPALPPQLGGGPTTDLTRNLSWLAVGLATPPAPKLSLAIQSPTADGAAKLADLLSRAIALAATSPAANQQMPGLADALAALKPAVEGTTVRATVEGDPMQSLLTQAAIAMHRAREQANNVRSASNERQLLMAVQMYAADNHGAVPPDLAATAKYLGKPDAVAMLTTDPRDPDRKDAYAFVRPAEKLSQIKNSAGVVMIYEKFDAWPGLVVVGFVDGHVEMINDEARFQALLDAQAKVDAQRP